MPFLFEKNQLEPGPPGPAGDTFFQDAGDLFPVQPEPEADRPRTPRKPPPAGPRYRDEPAQGGFVPTPRLVAGIAVAIVAVLVLAPRSPARAPQRRNQVLFDWLDGVL